MHLSLIQFVMVHRDRAYRMVGDPSDKHSDYDAAAKVIVCTDPYPYTVAGASHPHSQFSILPHYLIGTGLPSLMP